jgi:hypothetical protein
MPQEETMTMTPLLTARDTIPPLATAGLPPLATCSYSGYRRDMGTAVRITRYALRGVALPDPRYTDRPHWPVIRSLCPADAILHKGLHPAEFAALYRNDLARVHGLRRVCMEIAAVPLDPAPAPARLVLLCHEDVTAGETVCHRRVFAAWWKAQTGQDVPELA